MTVGALLDLGADRKVLEDALASLGVDGYHLHLERRRNAASRHMILMCIWNMKSMYMSMAMTMITSILTIMEIMTTITSILMTTAIPTITCTHTPTATSTTFTPLLTACSLPIK